MNDNTVLVKVREVTAPLLSDLHIELVDLTFRGESGGMVLRFTVDKGCGIGIDDCCRLSRQIEKILDESNAIEERYILEVQSPGLDRILVKTSDFERIIGKEVRIITREAVGGKMENLGKLKWVNDERVLIQTPEDREIEIARNLIVKAKLEINF